MAYQRNSDISTESYRDYLSPKWWPTWLGIGVILFIGYLPVAMQIVLGALLGLLSLIQGKRRRIAARNIELTHPHLSSWQRRKMLLHSFISMGRAITETARAWTPRRPDPSKLRVNGLEYVQQAHKDGYGVILMGAHFCLIDICGTLLHQLVGYSVVQRKNNNPLLNLFITKARLRYSDQLIARMDIKGMLKSLKAPESVMWYAPDQDYGGKGSVFVPFCGIPTATITATSKLAKSGNAKVIPIDYERDGYNRYKVTIFPPLDIPGESLEKDAEQINQWIESRIKVHPQDYLWVHRRFKTRPEGNPSLY